MKRKLQNFLYSVAIVLISVISVNAQVTTGSLTGIVKDSKETVIGSTVKATHLPTGSVYATTTNAQGKYNLLNLRPGGPYKIEVTFLGLQPQTFNDVFLRLGEPFVLNVTLTETSRELSEVVVSAGGSSILSSNRTGAVTNIGTREINTLPTISRSINDITRVTPQAQGSSIAGGNYRQNNITVDGANFNNSFGIGDNLPGGQATPIPLDALGEISVNVAPVDVRQSGFVGGAVNLTTRSGTNEFSGSAYTYYRNQDNVGTKVKNYAELVPNPNDVKIYGARIGGPIIKDKLFFFGSVESEKQARPGQNAFAQTGALPFPGTPNARRPTAARLTEISNYLRNTYGYETGAFEGYGFASERLNIVGRLDWNINNKNRFNIRYSQLESKNPSFLSSSTTPLTNTPVPVYGPAGGSRLGNTALHFQNSNYFTNNNYYSLVGELNSTIASKYNNTLRVSYSNQNEPRTSESSEFPLVDILENGEPFTTFGYEPFTFGNLRDVQSINVIDYVQATFGKHNLLGGVEFEKSTTKNGFQRFGTGYFVFNSWQDFVSGANARSYAKTYSLTPGYAQAFPTFEDSQLGIYFQDDFTVNEKLRLSFGLRGDIYSYNQSLLSHPLITPLTFANGERLDTGILPTSAFLISPRFGFNYDVKGDRSLQLRGSAGVFSGGIPNVWIVGQAGDSGLLQFTDIRQPASGQTTIPNTPFKPDPAAYLPTVQPIAGQSIPNSLSFLDPNIKSPQSFKGNLAVDKKLPGGIIATIEGIYSYDINQVLSRNPNLNPANAADLNVSGYAGNRLIYPFANAAKYINKLQTVSGNAIVTPTATGSLNTFVGDNKAGGYNYSITLQLQKQFNKGFSASVAYVKQQGKNFFDGGGDQFAGTWTGNPTVNGSNTPELGFNGFVPDRLFATVSYRKEYFKKLGTSITMFYEGSSQGRVSYTYSADFNQDGANADLIYVPKDRNDIVFTPFTVGTGTNAITYTPAAQADIFFRYIEQDNYLNSRKGKFAERNGGLLPWVNSVDFNLLQDLFVNIGKKRNTLQFNWTVNNFGNFINKNWGVRKQLVRSQILVPTNANSATGQVVPGGTVAPTFRLQFDGVTPVTQLVRDNVGFGSTYSMQFGFRYIFN
jgi:hypothetical protein